MDPYTRNLLGSIEEVVEQFPHTPSSRLADDGTIHYQESVPLEPSPLVVGDRGSPQ
jgi:hypothetical protein